MALSTNGRQTMGLTDRVFRLQLPFSPVAEPLAREVQEAFDAAVSGDIEPLVALLGDDVDWRGLERGRWLWRRAPA